MSEERYEKTVVLSPAEYEDICLAHQGIGRGYVIRQMQDAHFEACIIAEKALRRIGAEMAIPFPRDIMAVLKIASDAIG